MIIRQLRILAVLLTLLLALAACSSESPAPVAPSATPTRAPTAVPTTAPTQAPAATPTAVPTQAPAPEPTAAPQPTPTPKPAPNPFEGVQGILDPTNFGWPREVEGLNGLVSIPAKPLRIITASVGHDELTLALVPRSRLVGVGGATKNSTFSNVAALVQDITEISRDPETIIAQAPDVVVTSPFFPAEAIESLSKTGIPVIQTEFETRPGGANPRHSLTGVHFWRGGTRPGVRGGGARPV